MNGLKKTEPEDDENTEVLQMNDLLSQLNDFHPVIPDLVTSHYLQKSGVDTDDPRIVRIVSLAAQKFMADILNDAYQTCKLRGSGQASRGTKGKEKKLVLTLDDLAPCLAEYNINVKKPPYHI